MSKNKVVKIPITYEERKINEYGKGYVSCLVSERWLQFPETASHERHIPVNVMTQAEGKESRKICELILSKEDLLRAINSIKIEND